MNGANILPFRWNANVSSLLSNPSKTNKIFSYSQYAEQFRLKGREHNTEVLLKDALSLIDDIHVVFEVLTASFCFYLVHSWSHVWTYSWTKLNPYTGHDEIKVRVSGAQWIEQMIVNGNVGESREVFNFTINRLFKAALSSSNVEWSHCDGTFDWKLLSSEHVVHS